MRTRIQIGAGTAGEFVGQVIVSTSRLHNYIF